MHSNDHGLLREQYHTVVVGAGPAGVMAALHAAPAGDVLVVDAFMLPRDKSCGGMLNEYSQRFLSTWGTIPEDMVLDPAWVNFRYFDWDRDIKKATELRFANVDRAMFDEWLIDLLPDGVDVLGGLRLTEFSENDDHVVVTLRDRDGVDHEVRCAYLVGADGPRSSVRRSLGSAPVANYKTLQDFCRIEGDIAPYFDCIYSRTIAPDYGYGYVIPKGDVAIVGSVFFPGTKHPLELHLKAIETFRSYYPLGESVKREAWTAIQVLRSGDIVCGRGRVLLAGEAGGFMSPSSGEGISFALNTGSMAGSAIAAARTTPDVVASYTTATSPVRKNIGFRIRMFPFMNSDWGKWIAGYIPTPIVSKVTERL